MLDTLIFQHKQRVPETAAILKIPTIIYTEVKTESKRSFASLAIQRKPRIAS